MKTAIVTLLSVFAVASVSTAAGAQKLRTSLITNTQLSQIDFKTVNDAIAPIYTPVASIEDTRKNDDGNNDK